MPSDGDGDAPAAETAPSSVLPWGDCPTLYLSYGIASLQGRLPELTDALAAVPSFTTLSPPLGLDYFGVFDGHFGAAVANRLSERLHGAISEQIESELSALFPRFLHGSRGDVEGWWREAIADAFLAVDEEVLMRGSATGTAAAGATALVALVLKDYLVLANCGVSRAVISRGGEAVQLTAEHRPNRPDEKQRVENAGGRVDESTNTVDGVLPTSRAFGSSAYKQYVTAEPEVRAVARDPRDEFLILATAGLWDHVSPAAACRLVERKLRSRVRVTTPWVASLGGRGSPTALAKELAEHAVRAGSPDNVSVVLVLFRDFWDDPVAAPAAPVVSASGRVMRPRRASAKYRPNQWFT
ncbi:probable protein phosphatase 2C 8 isoform X2 [Lolium perenne]|uniref:probable protein phosphatase 2C 8 isoform X2 n=1 Tax=Lolium perenne TaxID=4522 RepID=UPI0021EA4599|nr:probable protein phosphatase 2C 8 isoform X2 [Lolium perenne]